MTLNADELEKAAKLVQISEVRFDCMQWRLTSSAAWHSSSMT